MKEYKTRLADSILQKKLASSGAVLIEGANGAVKQQQQARLLKVYYLCKIPHKKAKHRNGRYGSIISVKW